MGVWGARTCTCLISAAASATCRQQNCGEGDERTAEGSERQWNADQQRGVIAADAGRLGGVVETSLVRHDLPAEEGGGGCVNQMPMAGYL